MKKHYCNTVILNHAIIEFMIFILFQASYFSGGVEAQGELYTEYGPIIPDANA